MLCDKCSSIHFKRRAELQPSQSLSTAIESDDELYYMHHDIPALEQSKATCDFCRKIWDEFCQWSSPVQPLDKYKSDPGSTVYLVMNLPSEDILKEGHTTEEILRTRSIYARCPTVQAQAVFRPEKSTRLEAAMRVYLERISFTTNNDTTLLSDSNMELARIWLQHCHDNHQPCKQLAKPGTAPLRIIDITAPEKPFLTMGHSQLLRYATLSYKWGNTRKYLTTSENLSQHQDLIPPERLPKTFKDAIIVARAMGFSYFWIDALCIQHDVREEVDEQMNRMGEIYSSSTLTIFAAVGNNSDHGLGTYRDGALTKPSAVHIRFTVGEWNVEAPFYVRTMSSLYQEDSPLTKRGWVLQEEALSARGLWFGRREIKWNCLCESATETCPGVTTIQILDEAKLWSNDLAISSLMGIRHRIRESSHHLEQQQEVTRPWRQKMINLWYSLIENFTARELTYSSDVLPALSGIASKISEIYGLCYVAGLWEEDLQHGLLWKTWGANTLHESQQIAKYLGNHHARSDTKQETSRVVTTQSPACQLVSDRDGDWENITNESKASFSWISNYLSGKRVIYDHLNDTQYIRQPLLGVQLLKVTVQQPPLYKNPLGKILSASLKVRARVKKALIADEDVISSKGGPYRLINIDEFPFGVEYIARFYPDSPEMIDRYSIIHCVLCMVALPEDCHPPFLAVTPDRTKWVFGCIGVIPSPAPGFIRVGLVEMLDKTWFEGCDQSVWDDHTDVQEFELI